MIFFGRVVAYVSETEIAGDQTSLMFQRVASDQRVFRLFQPDITRIGCFVTVLFEEALCRPRQIGIDQETHGGAELSGQRVMRFLFDELFGVLNGRLDVGDGQVILATDFLKAHAAGQTAENSRHGHACAANYRLAMLDFGVNDNSFVHIFAQTYEM